MHEHDLDILGYFAEAGGHRITSSRSSGHPVGNRTNDNHPLGPGPLQHVTTPQPQRLAGKEDFVLGSAEPPAPAGGHNDAPERHTCNLANRSRPTEVRKLLETSAVTASPM